MRIQRLVASLLSSSNTESICYGGTSLTHKKHLAQSLNKDIQSSATTVSVQ